MNPAESPAIQAAVAAAELELKDTGRIVLRASGTEPVIRVMVEGQDETMVRALATRLAAIVSTATN
jgi:phosphoglucosamine mutase